MSNQKNICLSGNNGTLRATGKSSDMDYMTSLQISEVTGKQHKDVLEAIRNMEPAWVKTTGRKFPLSEYKDTRGRKLPMYQLSKTECLYIATKFNDEARARLIIRWEELEMEKQTPVRRITSLKVSDRIRAAKFLASFLNLNESSKLLIAKSIAEPLGLPTPDYTPSKGILHSCAELLKEHGSALSAQQFNQRMIQHGYMTQMSRPSSKGEVKKFKSIVADGLQYGENQVNPNNPKSTQPLYYADRFTELLNILTV